MNWIEKKPKFGDTVLVEYANWTNLPSEIGIYKGNTCGREVIQMGDRKEFLWPGSISLVALPINTK